MLPPGLPSGSQELLPGTLWRSAAGAYLQPTPAGWTALEEAGAVMLVYQAGEANENLLPPAMAAARHLRRAVIALAPPPIPAGEEPLRGRAAAVSSRAVEVFHACKMILTLLRTVQRDIRAHRGAAGYTVVHSHGQPGSRTDRPQKRAAEELEVSEQTLSELISGR